MKSANTIPKNYPVCMHGDCPLAEKCLHQLAFRRQEEMGTYLSLLNPSKCTKQPGCPHYADSKPVRFAKGFTGFQKKMYPEQYGRFMTTLIQHFGRNQYFKRRRGDILLSPEEQDIIKYVLEQVGANSSMDFDQYVEETRWVP